jgi:hypothetical protein
LNILFKKFKSVNKKRDYIRQLIRYLLAAGYTVTFICILSPSDLLCGEKTNTIDNSALIFYPVLMRSNLQDSINMSLSPKPDLDNEIKYGRLALVGGTLATGMVAIHIYQQNGWWKDNRAPFHFREDLVYGLGVDKIGHFYGASAMAFVVQKSVEWANVQASKAIWFGSGAALLFQTYVEVEDGFSAWGFDRVDFASDAGGAAWPLLQYYVPFFRNFDLKLSYTPSQLINNPGGSGFKGQKHLMIDDYEGQTLWLSFYPDRLLPKNVESYWPDFLSVAVGYGARDIAKKGTTPYQVYFLALDYDMTKIIPDNTWFLKTLGRALNFIHFPAPAVRISPATSTIWYGLYF